MKIKFTPTGQEIEGSSNESLLKICTKNGIEIKSICHGVPSCAECRIRIVAGENNILPPSKAELALIGSSYYLDGRRLSCQVRAFGDITVDLTEQLERGDQGNKKLKGARALGRGHELKATQSTLVLEAKPMESSTASEPGVPNAPKENRPPREKQGGGNRGHRQGNRGHGQSSDGRSAGQRNDQRGPAKNDQRNDRQDRGGKRS